MDPADNAWVCPGLFRPHEAFFTSRILWDADVSQVQTFEGLQRNVDIESNKGILTNTRDEIREPPVFDLGYNQTPLAGGPGPLPLRDP